MIEIAVFCSVTQSWLLDDHQRYTGSCCIYGRGSWIYPDPLTCQDTCTRLHCVTHSWLRHCASSWQVAGSIPDGVIGIFHWCNPSGCTVALGLTQPLTEMSKSKGLPWQAKVTQRVPGRLRSQSFLMFQHYKGGRSCQTHRPPLPQEKSLVLSEAESTSGHVVLSGVPQKKSPVTPPGIDPWTVRLVAQRLNHYATPCLIISTCTTTKFKLTPKSVILVGVSSITKQIWCRDTPSTYYVHNVQEIWCTDTPSTYYVHNVQEIWCTDTPSTYYVHNVQETLLVR